MENAMHVASFLVLSLTTVAAAVIIALPSAGLREFVLAQTSINASGRGNELYSLFMFATDATCIWTAIGFVGHLYQNKRPILDWPLSAKVATVLGLCVPTGFTIQFTKDIVVSPNVGLYGMVGFFAILTFMLADHSFGWRILDDKSSVST